MLYELSKLKKNCADENKLKEIWGEKRERLGIFEGDVQEGALEAGQSAGLINEILTVKDVFENLIDEFDQTITKISHLI